MLTWRANRKGVVPKIHRPYHRTLQTKQIVSPTPRPPAPARARPTCLLAGTLMSIMMPEKAMPRPVVDERRYSVKFGRKRNERLKRYGNTCELQKQQPLVVSRKRHVTNDPLIFFIASYACDNGEGRIFCFTHERVSKFGDCKLFDCRPIPAVDSPWEQAVI